jgi:hypothetical protein
MARLKFTAQAGPLLRTNLRRKLEEAAFKYDLKLDLKEDKGWFTSAFFVTFEGPANILKALKKWLEEFERELMTE